ncbi:MAG: ATP-binding protein [Candidatus Krumholzibacteriia bacterium]
MSSAMDARGERDESGLGLNDPALRAALDGAVHLAAVACGADGCIRSWNLGAEHLLGHRAETMIGAHLGDLMRTDGQRVWARRVLDPRQPLLAHRAILSRRDGSPISCLVMGDRIAGADGLLQTSLLILPLQPPAAGAAERSAERLPGREDAVSVLAGGIAHDFNNLLLGIMGNADLLLMELPSDHASRDHIEQITQAGLRAADLCRQLMAFSGAAVTLKDDLDVNALIGNLLPLARMSLGPVPLSLHLSDPLPRIEGDAAQLRQVLINLVTNAAEAISERPDGRIEIRTSARAGALPGGGEAVVIEVVDNGVGMTPEQIDRAFDPFYTTKFLGRGLGLAAAQGIARAHLGGIHLCSSPGAGTTVTVALPCGRRSAEDGPTPTSTQPPLATRSAGAPSRILVVDDEAHVRLVADGMLRQAHYEVVLAEHGGEALAILADDPGAIDLVVLDMTMPGLTGGEVLERIRELRADLPVLLSSGYGPELSAHLVADDPRCAFLPKPYRRQDLLAALDELLPEDAP